MQIGDLDCGNWKDNEKKKNVNMHRTVQEV